MGLHSIERIYDNENDGWVKKRRRSHESMVHFVVLYLVNFLVVENAEVEIFYIQCQRLVVRKTYI